MQSLNEFNFKEAFSSSKPIVLKFYAEWCRPCTMFKPIMESVSDNIKTIECQEVNLEVARNLSESMNIKSIPTTILIWEGKEVSRFTGIRTAKEIYEWFNQNLPRDWNVEQTP